MFGKDFHSDMATGHAILVSEEKMTSSEHNVPVRSPRLPWPTSSLG